MVVKKKAKRSPSQIHAAQLVQELRSLYGEGALTQEEIAQGSKTPTITISRWLRGVSTPSRLNIPGLEKYLAKHRKPKVE